MNNYKCGNNDAHDPEHTNDFRTRTHMYKEIRRQITTYVKHGGRWWV